MKFLYSNKAKEEEICVENEQFLHLKARRAKIGDKISVRNLKDELDYIYEIINLNKKNASLKLISSSILPKDDCFFQIACGVIDENVVEKTLPILNEIGVFKLHFIYLDFSQKNIKYDLKRLERILIQSSQQCGRNSIMTIEIHKNLDNFLKIYKNVALIDFGGKNLNANEDTIYIIGPEGGFSKNEREKIKNKFSLNSKYILKTNSALVCVAAKIMI